MTGFIPATLILLKQVESSPVASAPVSESFRFSASHFSRMATNFERMNIL